MADVTLKVNNLSKIFYVKRNSLGDDLQNHESDAFYAVKDLTFDIRKGEICGLIGRNGAGKTTLLELLSGITKPSKGNVIIKGKTASVIDIGTGMHRDLSGLENIFLSGEILGMSKREIQGKLPEIIAFSELKDFLHRPIKHYSSGMFMRLAFSVITHLNADIMLIDEIIGVGDLAFSEKTTARIIETCKQGRSAIIATHSLMFVKGCCNTAMYLKNGALVSKGSIDEIEELYLEDVMGNKSLIPKENTSPKPFKPKLEFNFDPDDEKTTPEINFLWARIGAVQHDMEEFSFKDELRLELLVDVKVELSFILSVHINYHYNQPAFCLVPEIVHTTNTSPGRIQFTTLIPPNVLNQGLYTISAFLVDQDDKMIVSHENFLIFKINYDEYTKNVFGYSGKFSGPVFKGGNWVLERV